METNKIFSPLKKMFNSATSSKNAPTGTAIPQNPNAIQQGETYNHWGLRICGLVTGSVRALLPCLQSAYRQLYHEQAKNEALQDELKASLQSEIAQKKHNIEQYELEVEACNKKIGTHQEDIDELSDEKVRISESKGRVNKEQRLKLIIGLCIIIPMTFYLFLFYSSTFYSAFFRDINSLVVAGGGVMAAMFDPNALPNAYNGGVTELLFVLSAPIIFMGLGFCLHFFAVQENWAKYVKMGAILLVTLMFDCILAYLIAKQLYTIDCFMTGSKIPFSISLAVKDVNTWAVIFCGFIVYIIWGVVFDMIMTAYQKMDFNNTRRKEIDKTINALKDKIATEQDKLNKINSQITAAKNDIERLKADLCKKVYIDYNNILQALANFYTGWVSQMRVLSCPSAEMHKAEEIYNNMINNIKNQ